MGNVVNFPVVSGIEITTDDEGRFNLNALHKASALGDNKKPSKWLRSQQAKNLIERLEGRIWPSKAVRTIKGQAVTGTFAHELIAISYAGWISPDFQLDVNQVFSDYKTGQLQPAIPQSLPEALRYAAQLEEEKQALAGKAQALERIAESDGSMAITNAAKDLQMRPRDLFNWLSAHKWIYRRAGSKGWIAYQNRLQQGLLEQKVTTVERADGSEKTVEQVRVTPKGLALLSQACLAAVV